MKGAKSAAERGLTDNYHRIQKPALLAGIARSYTPKDDEGERLPGERTKVQLDVETAIQDARKALSRYFDIQATLDYANTQARADVLVDGQALLSGVPATYLLFLEKRLAELRAFVTKLPLLDPAEEWHPDENVGVWATSPTETVRTKKVPRNHVLSPATDRHPAQVQVWQEDVVVGTWRTIKFSGAMAATRRDELLERIDTLTAAVKFAREEANSSVVDDIKTAKYVFDYLFA